MRESPINCAEGRILSLAIHRLCIWGSASSTVHNDTNRHRSQSPFAFLLRLSPSHNRSNFLLFWLAQESHIERKPSLYTSTSPKEREVKPSGLYEELIILIAKAIHNIIPITRSLWPLEVQICSSDASANTEFGNYVWRAIIPGVGRRNDLLWCSVDDLQRTHDSLYMMHVRTSNTKEVLPIELPKIVIEA